jgi:deazaflavin-dependent oxidoreductase (nitroreductase family)
MTSPTPAYSDYNRNTIDDFRAHGGRVTRGPHVNSDLLLLHTIGARSGSQRVTPVVYTRDGDRLVIVASKGGAPTNPAWFVNLVADPVVTVEVGVETFKARAIVAGPEDHDRLYARHAERYPNFLDYQRRTSRIIPVVLLQRIA